MDNTIDDSLVHRLQGLLSGETIFRHDFAENLMSIPKTIILGNYMAILHQFFLGGSLFIFALSCQFSPWQPSSFCEESRNFLRQLGYIVNFFTSSHPEDEKVEETILRKSEFLSAILDMAIVT